MTIRKKIVEKEKEDHLIFNGIRDADSDLARLIFKGFSGDHSIRLLGQDPDLKEKFKCGVVYKGLFKPGETVPESMEYITRDYNLVCIKDNKGKVLYQR